MKIEDLIEYQGDTYKGRALENFILKARENLAFLEGEIAKENEAKVYLKDDTLTVVGFTNENLAKQVFAVLHDILYL